MSLLAQLVAKREGFGIPGALPTRNSNPGDLRHAPGEMHAAGDPNGIGSFDSVAAGWAALEHQLTLFAGRNMNLAEMVAVYAPPTDGNKTAEYLDYVCKGLGGCPPTTLVSDALKITGVPAMTTPDSTAVPAPPPADPPPPVPVTPWYRAQILQGALLILVTQALAHSGLAAIITPDQGVALVNAALELITPLALGWIVRARVVGPVHPIAGTKTAQAAIAAASAPPPSNGDSHAPTAPPVAPGP